MVSNCGTQCSVFHLWLPKHGSLGRDFRMLINIFCKSSLTILFVSCWRLSFYFHTYESFLHTIQCFQC
jgi:hypothetical protein